MSIAARSVAAWLESQERMMRAWRAELVLSLDADPLQIERIDAHCDWLARERDMLLGLRDGPAPGRNSV